MASNQPKFVILSGTAVDLASSINTYMDNGYALSGTVFTLTGDTNMYQAMVMPDGDPTDITLPTNWNKRGEWAANTEYASGDSFTYQGKTYLVLTPYTSANAFDDSYLRQITYDLTDVRDVANGLVAIDGQKRIILDGVPLFQIVDGHLLFIFPFGDTDPGVPSAVWNNGGTLYVSNGPSS